MDRASFLFSSTYVYIVTIIIDMIHKTNSLKKVFEYKSDYSERLLILTIDSRYLATN